MTLRRISAAMLALVGVIHLILAPEYLEEQAYVGVLFIAGGVALAILAIRLYRGDDTPSWLLGALIMVSMGAGFVLSRTVGLPGFKESEWELSGVICLLLEAAFLISAAGVLSPPRTVTA